METTINIKSSGDGSIFVLEVTMRDGNLSLVPTLPAVQKSFRSDYEGWKLCNIPHVFFLLFNVLEVTMRDGNTTTNPIMHLETNRFRSDYEGWKLQCSGCVFPSAYISSFRSDYEGWKPFYPIS